MLNLELSWQDAAIASGCLFAVAGTARTAGRSRLVKTAAVSAESATLLALFALWQFAGRLSILSPHGALARARWLWDAERAMHLPSEAAIQAVFLPHPLIVQVFNLYYAALHFMALIACLIWLFARHRPEYGRIRMTVVLFTAASLLIQFIPVAPPRMLSGDHMVDTAVRYGQSVYASVGGFAADQLSAMPSVHIGWALIVALALIQVSRSRWRWLAAGYPALTTLVVIVTANHFWLDGIVAAILVAAVLAVQHAGRAARRALRAARRPDWLRPAWHNGDGTRPPARPSPARPSPKLPMPARSWLLGLAAPLNPVLVSYALSPSQPDGEAEEASAAAADAAEAPPEAASWPAPRPGPPGQPVPGCERKPTGSR
jgi:PAP2 superfamily